MKRTVQEHPFEICIATALILLGVNSLALDLSVSELAHHALPTLLLRVWQVGVLLGGLLVLLAILQLPRARKHGLGAVARAEALEQGGLVLMSTGVTAYVAVVVMVTGAGGAFVAVALGSIALACLVRVWAIRDRAKIGLAALQQVNGQ